MGQVISYATLHWPEPDHRAHQTSREAGQCRLAVAPRGKQALVNNEQSARRRRPSGAWFPRLGILVATRVTWRNQMASTEEEVQCELSIVL